MLLLRKSLSKIYHRNNSVPSKQPLSLDLHSSSLFTNVSISWYLITLTRIHLINANLTGVCRYSLIFSVLMRVREQCSVAPSADSVVLTLTHPVSPSPHHQHGQSRTAALLHTGHCSHHTTLTTGLHRARQNKENFWTEKQIISWQCWCRWCPQ